MWGRLFFGYSAFGEAKESDLPPGNPRPADPSFYKARRNYNSENKYTSNAIPSRTTDTFITIPDQVQ